MNKFVVVGFCLLLSCKMRAQFAADSLQSVTITATRFNQFNTGSKVAVSDSILGISYQTQNLSDLLANQSQVFIKNYGQGSATSSFRGASAEQTAVLWKGFNLQNPMLGQVDFSLITGDVFDKIAVQYGGNGALFGSGAVGGTVQLLSQAKYNTQLHASAGVQVGSFGHLRKQASLSYGGKNWYSTAKYFQLTAQNDFEFVNTFLRDAPTVKQTNAAIQQQGFITENYFKLSKSQELNVNFWYQQSDRQIPPTMSVPQTLANQNDETYRATADWKLKQQYITWMARTAYFDERINYANPVSSLLSGNSRSRTSISEVESNIQLHQHHSLNIGLNNTYTAAFADGYGGTFNQNRFALFASYKTTELLKNVTTAISIREQFVKAESTPIMPSMGVEWRAKKWLTIFGNASRSYRLPTFNEMYWRSVTTHIQPEIGWGQELNIKTTIPYKKWNATATAGVFNRTIQNWIVWQPAAIDWAPQNVKQVWSRGAELDAKLSYSFNKCIISYHFMLNYVLSTNTQTHIPNDATISKQLIYVPRISQQHQILAAFKTWHIALLHNYTGLRYTTTDNTDWLNGYTLTSAVVGKQFTIQKIALVLSAQANNILNTTYQAIADRPMPGRNFLLNTTIKF